MKWPIRVFSRSLGGLGTGDQGETITISLEEATQIILQQQGLEGAAIQMPDGSYQLLAQQFIQVGSSWKCLQSVWSLNNLLRFSSLYNKTGTHAVQSVSSYSVLKTLYHMYKTCTHCGEIQPIYIREWSITYRSRSGFCFCLSFFSLPRPLCSKISIRICPLSL